MQLISVSLLLIQCGLVFADEEITFGKRFASPDGRYSVHLAEIDKTAHYVIEDKKTGLKDQSIEMPTLLLFLKWGPNSKSFATVEHIARGSYGRIVYFQGGKWMAADINPPESPLLRYRCYATIRLEVEKVIAHFRYVVSTEGPNAYTVNNELCDIDASLETGKILMTKCTAITNDEASALLSRRPEYFP